MSVSSIKSFLASLGHAEEGETLSSAELSAWVGLSSFHFGVSPQTAALATQHLDVLPEAAYLKVLGAAGSRPTVVEPQPTMEIAPPPVVEASNPEVISPVEAQHEVEPEQIQPEEQPTVAPDQAEPEVEPDLAKEVTKPSTKKSK